MGESRRPGSCTDFWGALSSLFGPRKMGHSRKPGSCSVKPLHHFPFEGRGQRAQATRLERNDGSTVTASGLGLNSHTPPSAVHTARCVPRRIACRTYRRMRERWCLAHIRRPPGQLEAPTSSCRLRIANVTWSTLLKSHRAARQLLAQHEAGGRYLPSSISTMPIRAAH